MKKIFVTIVLSTVTIALSNAEPTQADFDAAEKFVSEMEKQNAAVEPTQADFDAAEKFISEIEKPFVVPEKFPVDLVTYLKEFGVSGKDIEMTEKFLYKFPDQENEQEKLLTTLAYKAKRGNVKLSRVLAAISLLKQDATTALQVYETACSQGDKQSCNSAKKIESHMKAYVDKTRLLRIFRELEMAASTISELHSDHIEMTGIGCEKYEEICIRDTNFKPISPKSIRFTKGRI